MKPNCVKLSACILLGLGLGTMDAQQATTAAGGDVSGSGGSVSYSVGQVVYTTHTGATGSVAEGVQQPYEISVVTGVINTSGIQLNASAYPNPATDLISLKINDYSIENLSYQLYDMSGRLMENKKISVNETNISMVNFAPAVYFLKVTDNNEVIKTFNIIKKQ